MTTTTVNLSNRTYPSTLSIDRVVVKVVVKILRFSRIDVSDCFISTCHRSSVGRAAVL